MYVLVHKLHAFITRNNLCSRALNMARYQLPHITHLTEHQLIRGTNLTANRQTVEQQPSSHQPFVLCSFWQFFIELAHSRRCAAATAAVVVITGCICPRQNKRAISSFWRGRIINYLYTSAWGAGERAGRRYVCMYGSWGIVGMGIISFIFNCQTKTWMYIFPPIYVYSVPWILY